MEGRDRTVELPGKLNSSLSSEEEEQSKTKAWTPLNAGVFLVTALSALVPSQT